MYDRLRFERGLAWDTSSLEISAQARKLLALLEAASPTSGSTWLDGTHNDDMVQLTRKLTEFLAAGLDGIGTGDRTSGSGTGNTGRILPGDADD